MRKVFYVAGVLGKVAFSFRAPWLDPLAGFALRLQRIEFLLEPLLGRSGRARRNDSHVAGVMQSRPDRGEKPKIAEVNLLGLTGDLDGTLTPRVVTTIETCSPKTSRLEGQSTQEEDAVDSNTAPTMHWASLQQNASCSSPSDQQAAAPLTKGDLLIVAFVSSVWLWAATWALTSAALR